MTRTITSPTLPVAEFTVASAAAAMAAPPARALVGELPLVGAGELLPGLGLALGLGTLASGFPTRPSRAPASRNYPVRSTGSPGLAGPRRTGRIS
jgi:hypothetical protein